MIGGEATVLSSGCFMFLTSNVNIVFISLKEVSMVEIRLSRVTPEITEVVGLAVDNFRERETVYV